MKKNNNTVISLINNESIDTKVNIGMNAAIMFLNNPMHSQKIKEIDNKVTFIPHIM
jgi:hypothetical protein